MPDNREAERKQYKEDLFKTKAYEEFKNSVDTEAIVTNGSLSAMSGSQALPDRHDAPQKPDTLPKPGIASSSFNHIECGDSPRIMNEERVTVTPKDYRRRTSRRRCNISSLIKHTIIKMKASIPFRSYSLLRFRIPRFRGLMHAEGGNEIGPTDEAAFRGSDEDVSYSPELDTDYHNPGIDVATSEKDAQDKGESAHHSEYDASSSWVPEECSLAFESDEMEESDSLVQDRVSAKMHHDANSASESDLDSSALEFPDDASSEPTTMERMLFGPILRYIQSLDHGVVDSKEGDESMCTDRDSTGRAIEKDNGSKATQNVPRSRKKNENNMHIDLRYLYFLKKVCNLTKKDALDYCRDQNRLLMERGTRNRAELLPKARYISEIRQDSIIIHTLPASKDRTNGLSEEGEMEEDGGTMKSVVLRGVSEIRDLQVPAYNRDEFGYLVYKYGDGLVNIAKGMEMGLKDVILIYYLEYHSKSLEITGSLLEKYVEEEWTITDRILFEESFMRYGTRFSKFIINKSEDDLRIYYRYYLKNYIPMNWTEEERAMFSVLFSTYKKDWNSMHKNFPNKSANDLKVFYGSYFKKLDEEERIRESQLAGGGEKFGKKGRRPAEAT